MSRLLLNIGLCFVLFQSTAYGQLNLSWMGGSDYLSVSSYEGAVSLSEISKIKISGNGNIVFENWKLSARIVNYPVMNGRNVFPAEKVSFSPTVTAGVLIPGPVPTVEQIGIPPSVAFINGANEVFLVPNSHAPIVNNSPKQNDYFELEMRFNLTVAPGSYLKALQPWKEYPFLIEYTLYNKYNTAIARLQQTFKIQVKDLGAPPPDENKYSIRVSSDASNGLLEFKTASDYVNGKSVTYTNGLTVSATTAYQVTVRSISAHFSSVTGSSKLPLDVVRLQLGDGARTQPPVTLSSSTKTILQGESTNGVSQGFDITYSTEANDPRLFSVPSDHYSTSLMYEISPR